MPSKSPHPELECLLDCHVTSWTLFIKYYESMTRKVNTIHPSWKGFTCNHLPGVNGPGWLVFQLVYKTQRTLQETQTQCLNHAIKKSCIMSGKAPEDFKTSTIPSCYPIPSAQQFAAVFFLSTLSHSHSINICNHIKFCSQLSQVWGEGSGHTWLWTKHNFEQ